MATPTQPAAWTAALASLPARERLEWTRTINADVEALAKAAKQPAPGAFSRAYASAVHGADGRRVALLERVAAGGHLAAVTRERPSSTDAWLARLLAAAADKAGVAPAVPFAAVAAPAVPPADAGGAPPPDGVSPVPPELLAAVQAAQLGVAYRLAVARSLERRLRTDPAWAAEAAARGSGAEPPPPHAPHHERHAWGADAAALARGELTSAAAAAWESAQELRAALAASRVVEPAPTGRLGGAPPGDAGGGSGGGNATASSDAMLDAALDELLG